MLSRQGQRRTGEGDDACGIEQGSMTPPDDRAATTTGVGGSALQSAWRRHRRWSEVANAARDRLAWRRRLNLALLVLGAVAGAIAAQGDWPRGLTATAGVVAALALAAAAAVQSKWLSATEVGRWTAARAASEGLKAEVYRYLVTTPPYTGDDRDKVLTERVDSVEAAASGPLVDFEQARADDRAPPAVTGISEYLEDRARGQADWHRDRIGQHLRAARRIRAAEFAATAAAAVISAVGAALDHADVSVWIAVGTTLGAAFAAHLGATRHDRIAASYAVTADQLDRLIDRLPADADADLQAGFVDAVEQVLSVQNESWVVLLKPT